MTPDYRSARLAPEGSGNARRAWEACPEAVKSERPKRRIPGVDTVARNWTEECLGFWLMWHLYGGFEGLETFGYHRATIYRKISRFRQTFQVHPDDFEMPGVSIDLNAYWRDARERRERRRT